MASLSDIDIPPNLSEVAKENLLKLPDNQDFKDLFDVDNCTKEEWQIITDSFSVLDQVSDGAISPRPFQLLAALSALKGLDVIVRAGTGYGKTIAMVLPCLLQPGTVVITISPLKLLQESHVEEFEKYGIKTVAINEDTSSNPLLWRGIEQGEIRHLIVAPEQTGLYGDAAKIGHMPRFANLLKKREFLSRVGRVNIDEAHFIHTSGVDNAEGAAFRPAYGSLDGFRVRLHPAVTFGVYSATLPPTVLETLEDKLLLKKENTRRIFLSTNRPNLVYATCPMIGTLKNLRNLDCLIPPFPNLEPPLNEIKKIIVFIDHKQSTSTVANYLNSKLPINLRRMRPFRHLNGDMSVPYNRQTYNEFKNSNGLCRGLIATSSASNGLDVRDVEAVIFFGVPKTIIDLEQKAGRGGRDQTTACLILIIAEDWAFEGYPSDDEHSSKKQLRTEHEIYDLVGSSDCLRQFLWTYNNDEIPASISTQNETSSRTTQFIDDTGTAKKTKEKYRAVKDREALEHRLFVWRHRRHLSDSVAQFYPPEFILDSDSIQKLARARPGKFANAKQMTVFLTECSEWHNNYSAEIFSTIKEYNKFLLSKSSDIQNIAFISGSDTDSGSEADNESPSVEALIRERQAIRLSRLSSTLKGSYPLPANHNPLKRSIEGQIPFNDRSNTG